MDTQVSCSTDKSCSKALNGDSNNFDLIVVGGGSSGFSAAITAADSGARVALVSHGTIGGTCVNVGCVPSKNLIRAAEVLHQARAGNRFNGISASASLTDWRALIGQKENLVTDLRQKKYIDLLPEYKNITLIEGRAKISENGVLAGGTELLSDKVIIATGSSAAIPAIAGIEDVPYITSTEAFELVKLPQSMIVVGGGVIGCEVGQMFARFGTKVTILCRSRLLAGAEPEVSDGLEQYLKDEGVNVICGVKYESVEYDGEMTLCYKINGETRRLSGEQLLVATGRRPNIEDLGLEEIGIKVGERGIAVNDHMQTSRSNIYAAGDVTGRDQFVYMAAYGGKIAAANALNANSLYYDSSVMPRVVFTDPQAASVGQTEAQANQQDMAVKTSDLTLDNVPRALAAKDTRGLIKLIADAESNRLVGAHILAPEGADTIQTMALAIRQQLTVDELAEMIFPYLTTVE
ncbi:MAG: mercury(II) reductase, partial [Gammaproteobacteria bacterium]|nr:mercury(II) reductase [Gammaproteobacteria bacterium]